jgi:lipid II:glycine glycyltransferase (peptidoglycan interpeptide bridge formation enzyme)
MVPIGSSDLGQRNPASPSSLPALQDLVNRSSSVFIFRQDSSDLLEALNSEQLHPFQPLNDPRWPDFLKHHPRSSVFHTVDWLEALRRTYGYEPTAITTSSPQADLTNAMVLCRVESWLTGRRLVSLPFSDHCDVLADAATNLTPMVSALEKELHDERLRYVEIRPKHALETGNLGFQPANSYCLHQIDLRPDLDTLRKNCHKDSTQRKIRRAEREGLAYEDGRSASILDNFYGLMLLTRRRHRLPPQPKKWFQNLIDCFGEKLKIRVAIKDKQPIAAILTLRYKDTLIYKYGCSDAKFHHLGGMHLLLWQSIQEAKRDGLRVFDLGRSDWEDAGLIRFKDRWGAKRSEITYLRLLASRASEVINAPNAAGWKERMARQVFPRLPDRLLCAVGGLIYRHIG